MREAIPRYTLRMTKSRSVARIIGVGLIALVAGILLLNWIGGLGVQTPAHLDVDQYGNLVEVDE